MAKRRCHIDDVRVEPSAVDDTYLTCDNCGWAKRFRRRILVNNLLSGAVRHLNTPPLSGSKTPGGNDG